MAKLGELLVQAGAISVDQLQVALRHQKQHGGRLGTNLVELGLLSESALARTLSSQLRLPAVSAAALEKVPPEVIRLVPRDSAVHYRVIPVRLDGPHLWMAMSDPSDGRAIGELDAITHRTVRPMVAPDVLIGYALERHYGVTLRRRPAYEPPMDLRIDQPGQPSPSGQPGAGRTTIPPTPFADPYTPSERAALDARVLDLDEHPRTAVASATSPRTSQGRLGGAALGARLLTASSQRDVFEAALALLSQDFQRMVVLVVRGNRLAGFLSSGKGINTDALPDFASPLGEIPVFAKVLADGRPRLGRASAHTLGALTAVLGMPGDRAVLVMPVRAAGQPVAVIVAAEGRDGIESYVDEYVAAGHKLDQGLQILALRKKLMED